MGNTQFFKDGGKTAGSIFSGNIWRTFRSAAEFGCYRGIADIGHCFTATATPDFALANIPVAGGLRFPALAPRPKGPMPPPILRGSRTRSFPFIVKHIAMSNDCIISV